MRFRFLGAILGALVLLGTSVLPAAAQSSQTYGKVYLMRGLGNIFSLGMDSLAEKLQRRGINAQVYEHGQWPRLAQDAVAYSKANRRAPVVIIGHSLGADAAIQMAEQMSAMGVAPRLVVTFDPVGVTQVTRSGGRFVNYYQSNNGFGKRLGTGPGFSGTMVNRNLDGAATIDHFNIEKADTIHNEVIRDVLAVMRRPRPAPPRAPTPSPAPETVSSSTVNSATVSIPAASVQAVSQPATH